MKWKKLGKIFDPTQHQLPNGCMQFAQAPQLLECDDFMRIYFSSRSIDKNGKYLSHILFVDMKKNFQDIIQVSEKTVIPLGELGCFDEHGIFPMSILKHNDMVYGYTCGWSRRVSVSVETGIGLAISYDNGLSFERKGQGPILTASIKEPCLVGDGFVKIINGQFHMWYIFGLGWKKYTADSAPDRIYKIGHAESKDGVSWTKEEGCQIISDKLGGDESQALPTVIGIDKRYHMFFCYRRSYDFRNNKNRGYRIGHAYSDDLVTWIRDDDYFQFEQSVESWDSDMQCYPHVFNYNQKTFLIYNGNEFGRYGFGLAVLE